MRLTKKQYAALQLWTDAAHGVALEYTQHIIRCMVRQDFEAEGSTPLSINREPMPDAMLRNIESAINDSQAEPMDE